MNNPSAEIDLHKFNQSSMTALEKITKVYFVCHAQPEHMWRMTEQGP